MRKSGQKPITLEEIAKYQEYTKDSENILSIDNSKSLVLVSFKQINGFFVVVEQVKRKANELGFKTMYFEKGDYRQSNIYKETKSSSNAIHWL